MQENSSSAHRLLSTQAVLTTSNVHVTPSQVYRTLRQQFDPTGGVGCGQSGGCGSSTHSFGQVGTAADSLSAGPRSGRLDSLLSLSSLPSMSDLTVPLTHKTHPAIKGRVFYTRIKDGALSPLAIALDLSRVRVVYPVKYVGGSHFMFEVEAGDGVFICFAERTAGQPSDEAENELFHEAVLSAWEGLLNAGKP